MLSTSSVSSAIALVAMLGAAPAPVPLRVCADPNNLPYSNAAEQGFENAIADLVGAALRRPIAYRWMTQRRGFIRTGLRAGNCDLVIGLAAGSGMAKTTRPYYRSAYVFVTRADRRRVGSFDDAALAHMRIGIQVVGDDYANPPAAEALARRGLGANVRGYPVYGDYAAAVPMRGIVDAVAAGDVDVAVVWGPLAGYLAARSPVPLALTPVAAGPRDAALVFSFDIAMAVRRDDAALASAVNRVLAAKQREIAGVLRRYHVVTLPDLATGGAS